METRESRQAFAWFGWVSEYPEDGYLPIDAVDAEDAERQTRATLAEDDPETEISVVRVKADDVAMFQEKCEQLAKLERTNSTLLAAVEGMLAEPYGCARCDSGVLREFSRAQGKDHFDDCPYEQARAAVALVKGSEVES